MQQSAGLSRFIGGVCLQQNPGVFEGYVIKFNVSREAALKCVAMLQFFQHSANTTNGHLQWQLCKKIKCTTSTFNLSLFIISLSRLRQCTKKLMLPFARTPCMKRSLPEKSRRRGKKRLARPTATMSHPLEQIEQIKNKGKHC